MPVAGEAVLGLNAKTYSDIVGIPPDYATPTWVEQGNVQDVTINQSLASADVSTRGSKYRKQMGTLAEGSIDFTMIYAPGDGLFDILFAAFEDGTLVHMAFADGEIDPAVLPTGETTTYFEAAFSVLDFTQEQPLEDAIKVNVTLASGFSALEPGWKTIAGAG